MTASLVSIVIDNYNNGRFLRQAIDSALDQTYPSIEVVVADDGSTDESREIIADYAGAVSPVFKENGGQGSAFNAGFAASRGDPVIFLDADDFIMPHAVARVVPEFADPGVVRVTWPMRVVDHAGRDTGRLYPEESPPESELRSIVIRDGPYLEVMTPGNAWSRRFLNDILPIPEEDFRMSADLYLFTLFPAFGRMRALNDAVSCYRAHDRNHAWQRVLDEEFLGNEVDRFASCFRILADHLATQGVAADIEAWKSRNWSFLWLDRLRQAKKELSQLVPPGETLLLVHRDEWGPGPAIPGRTVLPFPEQNGQSAGAPADDASAIAELTRLQKGGASFLAFWWTAFWWLDYYSGFNHFLRSNFTCELENDRLVVFNLVKES